MTVTVQDTTFLHTGNGVTTTFAFGCKVLDAEDLVVTVDDVVKVLTTDYTINNLGNPSGGSVTFVVAPADGASIILDRIVPFKRQTDYQTQGDFFAVVVNKDFDKIWHAIQQIGTLLKRSLKLPPKFALPELFLPDPSPGKVPKWNAEGTALINSTYDPDSLTAEAAASAAAALVSQNAALASQNAAALSESDAAVSAAEAAGYAASINPANLIHTTGDETKAGVLTFTSSPIVPTLASSDNSTKAASTAFVQARTAPASTSVAGLMSAADKTKLDGIATGATVGLGEGQTWQNMTASRVKGTTYYNTTGRTIFVAIGGYNTTAAANTYFFTVGAVTFDLVQIIGTGARWHIYLPIPAGASYVLGSNVNGFDYWNELR